MVRLKPAKDPLLRALGLCLNSTMVRLKLKHLEENGVTISSSQFHYGSIKTKVQFARFLMTFLSQFHYGSIKTTGNVVDSKLVEKSQFHYGSIKTVKDAEMVDSVNESLNSTMVRLKRNIYNVSSIF